MTTLNQESVAFRPRRTAAILQVETDIVRRFEEFLATWVGLEDEVSASTDQMARMRDFADSFVEDFHFRRVETVLTICEKSGERRLGIWAAKFAEHQVHLRERLDGMARATKSTDLGSSTSFRWGVKVLIKVLGRYLDWAEHVLLPELRSSVAAELDVVITTALRLDEAKEVSHYAQAESILLSLHDCQSE